MSVLSAHVRFARPFTLVPPAVGMIAYGLVALGARPPTSFEPWVAGKMALGVAAAVLLNVASNGVNQIFDLEVDRINKPARPLPSGEIGLAHAWGSTVAAYALGIAAAAAVNRVALLLVLATVVVTYAYSGPPLRTKRFGLLANLTIAIPRGLLLPVAGWCAVVGSGPGGTLGGKTPLSCEIWALGGIAGLFVFGAATTKDFADIEGDRAGGCRTLPVVLGVRRATRVVAPFLVLPHLLLSIGAWAGILTGHRVGLAVLGIVLAGWGFVVARMLWRDPEALTRSSVHPSWMHMYGLMLGSQIGVALCYLAS
jgi:4-hydroxybenzoate polyprenyltransferase